jgi:hypothetical protein
MAELFLMFKNLKHLQPSQLIGFTRSIDWTVIDYDTRLVVLHAGRIRHSVSHDQRHRAHAFPS